MYDMPISQASVAVQQKSKYNLDKNDQKVQRPD
jgi:hypothetical protein